MKASAPRVNGDGTVCTVTYGHALAEESLTQAEAGDTVTEQAIENAIETPAEK